MLQIKLETMYSIGIESVEENLEAGNLGRLLHAKRTTRRKRRRTKRKKGGRNNRNAVNSAFVRRAKDLIQSSVDS